ncbi:amidohydrolase family protein [Streptomyces griseofuscus]|uniref:amidohydrolase family protein n=1 Tax=Streptomyces TaxID=1883 RepID=UPI001604A0DD|nr:amidohydrolase family protein [Streptomyces murinus]MBA9043291.1 2,3-dihydroxybenzoate decarboxylase [Streptomyces murinus]
MAGYIAIEEAVAIPGLADRRPPFPIPDEMDPAFVADVARRLPDITDLRLPDMDANGIAMQVLSLTVPGIEADPDPERAVANAGYVNDSLASIVTTHPDRFAAFAALPLQDPAAAVAELRRAVGELGFKGALVNDHIQGNYLDDPAFDAVWATLVELDVPLYLHPGMPPADSWHVLSGHPEMNGALWSWQATTGGHAMRIVLSGVFDRHPGARMILGHAGEFLPFQLSRFDSRYATLAVPTPLRRSPSQYFGTNVLATTSGILAPAAIEALVHVLGPDAVLFAVDYPYERTGAAVAALEQTTLPPDVKHRIGSANALDLLRL